LAAIPLEHRQTIGRWLYERAEAMRRASLVFGPAAQPAAAALASTAAVLVGTAGNLLDPESEDPAADHAVVVLSVGDSPVDPRVASFQEFLDRRNQR
jgi:hypothetical protein